MTMATTNPKQEKVGCTDMIESCQKKVQINSHTEDSLFFSFLWALADLDEWKMKNKVLKELGSNVLLLLTTTFDF